MRGKRSKQYRKLMHQYSLSFNFREPYQVMVDAEMIQDCARFKMNLPLGLERTLHGKVKPMITQCSIRHLYTAETTDRAQKDQWIQMAKSFERRRCNHHELPEPLSTLECLSSVVDPKSSATNRHRYVVASQEQAVRVAMRKIPGVPLVYVNRSVMIMEPMAAMTAEVREQDEKGKIRAGLKGRRSATSTTGAKRKRDESEDEEAADVERLVNRGGQTVTEAQIEPTPKIRKPKGPKGPNPLSMKKAKKQPVSGDAEDEGKAIRKAAKDDSRTTERAADAEDAVTNGEPGTDQTKKRRRRRKHKSDAVNAVEEPTEAVSLDAEEG